MSEATESSGTVKIVTFSGNIDHWDNWEFGFTCRAVIHGYDGILLGDVTAPTQVDFQAISVDTTDTAAKKTRKLFRYNSIAFSHLVSSMDASKEACHVPIGILKTARTTAIPGGDAYKGFKALQDYYFNKSVASVQALVKENTRKTLRCPNTCTHRHRWTNYHHRQRRQLLPISRIVRVANGVRQDHTS